MAFRTNKMPVLQTKSASGSVASFNTALAMPLASCNIAVNAWQEGSGDPSPVNERPIHGFSEVNATRCGVNILDEEWELGSISNTTGKNTEATKSYRTKNYIPLISRVDYYFYIGGTYTLGLRFYDINKNFISSRPLTASGIFRWNYEIPAKARFVRFVNTSTNTYANDISINYPSTQTGYIAYTGNIYTIQLGEEVYGGVYDSVSGVLTVTHQIVDLGTLSWSYAQASWAYPFFYAAVSDIKIGSVIEASCYNNTVAGITSPNFPNYGIRQYGSNKLIFIRNDDYTDATAFKTAMSGQEVRYELAEPFDIQLTPTQIETLIGNNTIFADTGDIDLIYKDLDIAKRGNFREVFRLPS